MTQTRPLHHLARRDDPETSIEAAQRALATGTVASHEAKILAVVQAEPGLTATEIAARMALDRVQIGRRLAKIDGIRRGDKRTSAITGSNELTWWPVAPEPHQSRLL